MKKFDALIIGSGQGGTPLAKKLAGAGYKTALIERRWVGGTCVNDGCTPTKALIASAKAAHTARNSGGLGINIGDYQIDIAKIVSRQQEIVKSFRNGAEKKLTSTRNLDLIYGEASFTDHKTVRVAYNSGGSDILTSELVFIDTGTSPSTPDIPGLDTIPYLTSTSILGLKELPGHLLIIGGGYIGMEFAQMYRRFGSRVTLLERSERILKKEDEDIASAVHQIFQEEDIDIRLHARALSVLHEGDRKIKVVIEENEQEKSLICSHVLVATGRRPNTDTLNPSATGVSLNEKGFIAVDNRLQTSVAGVYALGDVNGGPAFTHISYHDQVIIYNNLVHQKNQNTDSRLLTYCMYIDPQLGRVGMTEQDARRAKLEVKVASLPMANVARAIETGETRGLMKAVVDSKTKKILGASILAAEGGEIMSVIQVAMVAGLSFDTIKEAVFAHPTYAESLNNLFSSIE